MSANPKLDQLKEKINTFNSDEELEKRLGLKKKEMTVDEKEAHIKELQEVVDSLKSELTKFKECADKENKIETGIKIDKVKKISPFLDTDKFPEDQLVAIYDSMVKEGKIISVIDERKQVFRQHEVLVNMTMDNLTDALIYASQNTTTPHNKDTVKTLVKSWENHKSYDNIAMLEDEVKLALSNKPKETRDAIVKKYNLSIESNYTYDSSKISKMYNPTGIKKDKDKNEDKDKEGDYYFYS